MWNTMIKKNQYLLIKILIYECCMYKVPPSIESYNEEIKKRINYS